MQKTERSFRNTINLWKRMTEHQNDRNCCLFMPRDLSLGITGMQTPMRKLLKSPAKEAWTEATCNRIRDLKEWHQWSVSYGITAVDSSSAAVRKAARVTQSVAAAAVSLQERFCFTHSTERWVRWTIQDSSLVMCMLTQGQWCNEMLWTARGDPFRRGTKSEIVNKYL